jgi:hypothetical protein
MEELDLEPSGDANSNLLAGLLGDGDDTMDVDGGGGGGGGGGGNGDLSTL